MRSTQQGGVREARLHHRIRQSLLGLGMSPQLLGPVSSSDTPGEVLLSDSVHDRSTTTLVIIFPGSGSHHIGFWNNQALCMSYGTRRGSLLECVEWCHSRGFGVMILHWTRNFTNSGRPLKGSHTPEAHVKSAWDWVMHSVCFSHLHTVLLLGHSLGGSHIFELLRERHHQMRPLLAGIALADSVHQRNQITSLPQAAQQLISETCVHWVASDEPQGALLTMASKSCRNISAGDPRHHDTIVTALDSMLAYLEKRQLEHRCVIIMN